MAAIYNTLTELLQERKELTGTGITFIEAGAKELFLPYSELVGSAKRALSFLQSQGLRPKDELVFQLEDNRTFIIVFWACILGGIVPVPLAIGRNDDHKQKIFKLWPFLKNPFLITSPGNFSQMGEFAKQQGLESLLAVIGKKMLNETALFSSNGYGEIYKAGENDIAFVQFSSGSTGAPKGVMLTHKNLITNVQAISAAAGYNKEDSMLSWMPLTHDMGLIGFHINPLFSAMDQYLMPPGLFVRRPALWLDKATEHKVTILCSPNFGYEYLMRHCNTVSGQYNWDLRSVRLLYNGAEPISETLCRNFLHQLSKYGLKSQCMCPVYGLAEASLAVSISGLEDEVESLTLSRDQLQMGARIRQITTNELPVQEYPVTFVNVGKPVNDCLLRIADEDNKETPEEIIGHIQIKGDNVAAGYYNNTSATQQAITEDGWLKTGDLGFLRNGCLYITGRAKDILFSNGQNYYAHDIERIAQEIEGIELNKVVAAGSHNNELDKEEILLFILHRGNIADFSQLAASAKLLINQKAGLPIDRVIPVKEIPRTTSGKLQRFRLLELYKNGEFDDMLRQLDQLTIPVRPELTGVPTPEQHIVPEPEYEQRLLEVWKIILKTRDIGIDQHFFSIGGNSLRAAEMTMLALKEFQVDLPVETIYRIPTIRQLAASISALKKQEYIPIPVADKADRYPLTATQKRLYYFQQANPSSTAYNIPVALKITGEIDTTLLESCIQQLIVRHDSLRTIFPASVEPVFNVLGPSLVLDGSLFKLAHTEYSDVELKDLPEQLVRPFDLSTAPLFRANLIRTGNDEFILFLDFHHIISDGISVFHFIRELFHLYRGFALGPLPVQYKDHAASEKEYLQSERIKEQEVYWKQQLQGELPVLELPLDFQRPLIFDARGRKLSFEPDKGLLEKLRQLATRNECTLHVLLFTLYNILLYKYTGQQDIIIGIPVAGRRHPDLRQVLGMFVNNLAIRSTTTGDQTFAQLLSDKKNTIAEAFANQDYPFDHLIQAVQHKRDVGRNPVFDTMFVYQNMGFPAIETPVTVSSYPFDPGCSKFDLSLEIFEEENKLTFAFEYASSLFKQETIAGLASHFEVLMHQAADHPESPVSQLSLVSGKEYEEYIRVFNATGAPYPADKSIHQLFEEQVQRTPHNIAIVNGPEKISYQQLQEKADRLASILKRKGIGSGSIVAILLYRSPAMIISMLAVLKAGGAYLPIETDLPVGRIKLLINNSRCSIIIAGDGTTGLASGAHPEVIDIDKLDLTPGSGPIVQLPANSQDAAYVIYTSGTTGMPKGVVIEHRSLVNYIHWAAKNYIKKEKADFPLYTSISFDLTVTSIFVPLVTGNSIIIYKEEAPGSLIEQVVTDNRVDIIKATPSHLKILLQSKVAAFLPGSRINTIIVGGEKLETALALELYNAFNGNVAIYNEYGPTEATVGCMIHLFSPLETQHAVPIGVPAANTRIYVLDKYLQPVPTGVHGEIYIAGNGLARGYLFNESMTAEKFIPDPFRKGEKMYKTGDIAKWLPNGVIEYIGRSDLQVKINGYRIELSEIENALNGFPGISASLVTVRINPKNKQILSAFYLSTGKLTAFKLREYLADRLPYYMIPVHFTRVEQIPLTRNGKIDYNALPEPEGKDESNRGLPVSEIEAICLKVWEEVLGLTDLSVNDNFFELGGDSIKAVQISFRLAGHGISISAKDILTYQVIRSISFHAKIAEKGTTYEQGLMQGERSLLPIEAWFITRNFENPDHYNQSVLLTLNRPINIEWLQLAFKNIVRHHDGLRANYDHEKRKVWYNNKHLDDAFIIGEFEEDLATVCDRVKSSFEISNGLLLKAALIKDNSSLFGKLLITAHHLVMDGISWRILLEDLYAVYNAMEKGAPIRLPSKTASLIEWEKRLVEYAGTAAVLAEQPYWSKIENIEFDIPMDFSTHDWRMINIGIVKGSLNKETTGFLLKGAHQAYNTDILILLNAALAAMLQEWTGMDRFIIELENHGRYLDSVDTSRTIGWFTGMYPVALSCPEGNPGELIKAVKEQVRNTPAHGIGYGIWKYLAPGNRTKAQDVSITPIRFNYLGQFDRELNNDLFSYSTESSGSDADSRNKITAKLEFDLMIISEVLYVDIKYNRKAYKESTIQWISEAFLKKTHAILDHIQNETSLHFTPSDFEIDLNQQELDALFK